MSINEDVIIIDSDSDDTDIEELRKLAINSMVKEEKLDSYKEPANYQINVFSSFLPRKRSSSVISSEESKRPKIEESVTDSVENIIKDSLLEIFDINNVLNYSKSDNSINLLKEEELKNKLLKTLRNKKDLNQSNNEIIPISHSVNNILYESDDDNFDIFTHEILPEVITDPNILKYHNLITELKRTIEEVIKSINTISATIQEKLIKSKKITTQIENLKNQKTELHKEISINRRKILDLQKFKKQKSAELINYELLKRKSTENRQLSSKNVDFIDSLSNISSETNDSKTSYYNIDCNHLICPDWLNNICTNEYCIYQHPRFSTKINKPIKKSSSKIKENDKIFLKEMNPIGFICKLKCEACKINIFMSNLHIIEDRYCKSCCQQLINLKNPIDILNQLISIWHHFYKRFLKSKYFPRENQYQSSILQNLYKCSEAMKAKLTTVIINLPFSLIISIGCHIILTLNQEIKTNDLLIFLKSVNYNFQLVLFACKNLSFPIPKLYQLLIDSICYHIEHSPIIIIISNEISMILMEFSIYSKNLNLSILNQLFQWLEISIKLNRTDSHQIIINCLLKIILQEIIGSEFVPQLTLSMHELQFGDKYWLDRKESFIRIANLFPFLFSSSDSSNSLDISFCSIINTDLILIKYIIFMNFFTGNEEEALNLCEKQINRGYFFLILWSKLSLNYNSPSISNDNDKISLIEYTYNKSEWLMRNRSIKSCVKLLENLPRILYKISTPIEDSKQAIDLYETFLEIRPSIINNQSIIPNSNLSESEIKSILNQSAIWLCYINLAVLTRHDSLIIFEHIFKSDRIISMIPEHLNRIAQFIIIQFGKLYLGAAQYHSNLRRIFLFIDRSLEFVHFLDSFHVIEFDKLDGYQLQTWLFLIDFCIERFNRDSVDQFLVIISQRLAQNNLDIVNNNNRSHRQILHHIIMCYPIRCVEVWLNYIQLLLNLTDPVPPLHELIDACSMGVSQFHGSRLLWQYYYDCAVKSGDEELLKKIKSNSVKLGFELSK